MHTTSIVLGLLAVSLTTTARYIVPGARWLDTNGDLVNAHAGAVLFDDATEKFWLFGEYKIQNATEGAGVAVYSSEDLATWESHGLALGKFAQPLRAPCIFCRTEETHSSLR